MQIFCCCRKGKKKQEEQFKFDFAFILEVEKNIYTKQLMISNSFKLYFWVSISSEKKSKNK